MTIVKVSELEGAALDWAVAVATGHGPDIEKIKAGDAWCGVVTVDNAIAPFLACVVGRKIGRSKCPYHSHYFYPSTVWTQGGPLIDRYTPLFTMCDGMIRAEVLGGVGLGETYLIAACRAIVAAELGEEVDVPEELL